MEHIQCLIVDDEIPLAESTVEYFNLFEVSSEAVFDAESCLAFLRTHTVDLILLDINLGGASGFDLCKAIRLESDVPILFISARQSDDDVILALSIGGDDYIRKPYSLSVLLAKVKTVLKRYGSKTVKRYDDGYLSVDFALEKVEIMNKPIKLKAMEYKLLKYLMEHAGKRVEKEAIFRDVWEDSVTLDGTLNVHIRHIREKIEKDPNHPQYIQTIWGVGYMFQGESS